MNNNKNSSVTPSSVFDMTDPACDLELELSVANETICEAEEAFTLLRKDYHELRKHTDKLESLLRKHKIPFPDFWGW